jgi:hypothetical protein
VKANLRNLADQSQGLSGGDILNVLPECHPRRQPRSQPGEMGGHGGDAGTGGEAGQGGEGEAWRESERTEDRVSGVKGPRLQCSHSLESGTPKNPESPSGITVSPS